MALAHTPELNYKGIFRRSSIINKNEKIDRPMRSDLHRPGRDAATMWRHEMEEKPLVRSSNSESKVLVTEQMNFYFEFVLAGDNDVVQLTECCEGHLKEGVLMALIDIVSSMSNVRIKIGQFFLKLSKLDDCRKSIPSFYYIKVSLTAKIYLQYGNGSFKDINILHNNLSEYVHSNKLLTYLLRTGLSINRDVKEVKIKHNGCTIYTEAPSVAPTFITETPSKYKSPKAVSLVFQVALAGKKTAAELSSCCRDQVLSGMRKSLGNVLSGLSGRKLKDKNSEIIFDGSNSIQNEPNNNTDRFLEDNRNNAGPELEEVTIEFFDIGVTPEGDPLVSSKINVLIESDSSNEEDKSQLFNDMRGSFGDEIENGGVAQSIKSEGLAVEASAIQTEHPSDSPTSIPSIHPSDNPSPLPSFSPSKKPSISSNPSINPSMSKIPSREPTKIPTNTKFPSFNPTKHPSTSSQPSQIYKPSNNPSTSKKPSKVPSGDPSSSPSSTPSQTPSRFPSSSPSLSPSFQPSSLPSYHPSISPTKLPSILPSVIPTNVPSNHPSIKTSGFPSFDPSRVPSLSPSDIPSIRPNFFPSNSSHWVACGESTNNVDCDGSFRISYDIEVHGVRCCSDVSKDGFFLNDGCNVYAISLINETCYNFKGLKTYTEAVSICQSIQSRLCTKEEIGNGCTTNGHCSHQWMIWTSDRLEYPFFAGRVIHALDYDSISEETMLRPSSIVFSENMNVTYNQVDFGAKGATKSIQIRYGKRTNNGQIQFRIGGEMGQVIGQFEPVVTGNWRKNVNVGVIIDQSIVGKHDLTITASNENKWVLWLEWIELSSFDYPPISAIEYKTQQGTQSEGIYITEFSENDSLTYGPINFGLEGTTRSIFIRYAKPSYGGHIEFRQGDPEGLMIGTFNATETGSWDKYVTVGITMDENVGGIKDLTIVAKNDPNVMKLEWIKLSMLENVARHGSATQSSLFEDNEIYSASKAIDGIRTMGYESIAFTNLELNNWWQVTLDQLYPIFEVHVYNRWNCCRDRAIGFILTIIRDNTIVYNSSESDSLMSKSEKLFYRYQFDGIEGDTVRIEIHRTALGAMNLAEVEVFALRSNIPSTGPLMVPSGDLHNLQA